MAKQHTIRSRGGGAHRHAGAALARQASAAALALFEHGQREAARRGLLLVDTKYEFGVDAGGRILLVDEIHTPDSSRRAGRRSPALWLPRSAAEQHPQ